MSRSSTMTYACYPKDNAEHIRIIRAAILASFPMNKDIMPQMSELNNVLYIHLGRLCSIIQVSDSWPYKQVSIRCFISLIRATKIVSTIIKSEDYAGFYKILPVTITKDKIQIADLYFSHYAYITLCRELTKYKRINKPRKS